MRRQDEKEDEDDSDEADLFGRSGDEEDPGGLQAGQGAEGGDAHGEGAAGPEDEEPHPVEGRDPVTLHEPVKLSAEDVENTQHYPPALSKLVRGVYEISRARGPAQA